MDVSSKNLTYHLYKKFDYFLYKSLAAFFDLQKRSKIMRGYFFSQNQKLSQAYGLTH